MKTVGKMVLTLVAMLTMVATASAGDKLVVKGAGGAAGNVFRADDTGLTEARGAWSESSTAVQPNGLEIFRQPVLGVYNNDILRMNVTPTGITEWKLRSSTAESGKIAYSTPGGGVGLLLYTGATYDQNRFEVAAYPTVGTGGNALAAIGYPGSTGYFTIDRSTGNLGIGVVTAPAAKLDVDGNAIRIRTPQSPASNAACSAGTITWSVDYIYVCTASGAWKRAALTGGY